MWPGQARADFENEDLSVVFEGECEDCVLRERLLKIMLLCTRILKNPVIEDCCLL